MSRTFKLILSSLVLLTSILVPQTGLSQDTPNHFFPVRPIGMGGAFTAVANDENAIWMNPGGISRIRKARSRSKFHLAQFPNLAIGANSDARSIYSGLESQSSGSKDASSVIDESSSVGDDPLWIMAQTWPIMMFDFGNMPMAVGGYNNNRSVIKIDSDDSSVAYTEFITDVGAILSLGFTNRTNRLSTGFTIRSISRYAYEDTVSTATLIDKTAMQELMTTQSNESAGLGVDWGAIFTLADFWYPTIGISVLNLPLGCKDDYLNPFSKLRETVCGTVFTGSFANEDATSTVDPTDIRFGLSISPRITRTVGLRLAADVQNYNYQSSGKNYGLSEIPLSKTIHAGAELYVGNPLTPSPFSVRIGANQGFLTTGITVDMGYMKIDVASYGVDVSTNTTAVEDRRYLGQITFNM